MIKYLFLITILVGYSCKNSLNKEINNKELADNLKNNQSISKKAHLKKPLYIGVLKKFYKENDYYISLSFKNSTPTSFSNEFHENISKYVGKLLSKNQDNERYKIKDIIAEKYFDVTALDTIIVLNNNVKLDTLYRKNYEYLSGQTESQVIATYKKTRLVNKNMDYLCMSLNNETLKPVTNFKEDSKYLKETLIKNSFSPSNIHAHYKMIKNNDTISFISFGTYKQDTANEYFYLLKNKKPIDSIVNESSISKMIAVPIFRESEDLYIAYEFIPDSDISWTSLIGIDFKNNQLKRYKKNRIFMKN